MTGLSEQEIERGVKEHKEERDWESLKKKVEETSEAVRALAESLVETQEMGTDEMSALFRLCQHTGASSIKNKKKKVDSLNIPEEHKERVKRHIVKSMGSVGSGTYTVPVDGHENEALDLLRTLVESDSKEELDDAIQSFASEEINGVQSGTLSPIFFYLHPTKYPIINAPSIDGMEEIFGIEVSQQLSNYLDEAERYEKIRNKHEFKDNYRDLDWFLLRMDWETEKAGLGHLIEEYAKAKKEGFKRDHHWILRLPKKRYLEHFESEIKREFDLQNLDGKDISTLIDKLKLNVKVGDRSNNFPVFMIGNGRIWNSFRDLSYEEPDLAAEKLSTLFNEERNLEDRLQAFEELYGSAIEEAGSKGYIMSISSFLLMYAYPDRYIFYEYGVFKEFFEKYFSFSVKQGFNPDQYVEMINYCETVLNRMGQHLEDPSMIDVYNMISFQKREYEENTSKEALDSDTDYYWVNQTRDVEIENEFLRAPVDNIPHHDLSILDKGDIVFHYVDQELIGHSEVVSDVRVEEHDGEEYYFVDLDLQKYDDKPSIDQINQYLLKDEVRLDNYYPLNSSGGVNQGYLFRLSDEAASYLLNRDQDTRYFWINTIGNDWTEKFYSSKTSNGNPRRKKDVFEHASEGDKVAFFGIAPLQRIVGFGEVSEGMHKEEHEDHEEPVEGITVSLEETVSGPDWKDIQEDSKLQESVPAQSNNKGIMVAELEKDEYERLAELSQVSIELTEIPDDIQISATGLHFPGEKEGEIIRQVTRAIENGNHVLLVGPPGTGKSKLAKAVCESVMGDKYEFVTATSDWTTFDTVGGYHPEKDEKLVFKPGVFLSRFKDNQGNPQNEWLVVDEINRADIDKAFGSLFSVLAGDDATLSFTDRRERNIRILCNGDPEQGTAENVYYVPDDWRMVATMNTLDKTSLYEMSYAFMRRWAFVSVPVPEIPDENDEAAELVGEYVDVWRDDGEDGDEDKYTDIAELWRVVNKRREIGPAIVEDIYEHVENDPNPDYASAISMYVIPQLEGLRENELSEFVTDLEDTEVDVDTDRVKGFVEDYFQVDV